jgi:hypothetical protein
MAMPESVASEHVGTTISDAEDHWLEVRPCPRHEECLQLFPVDRLARERHLSSAALDDQMADPAWTTVYDGTTEGVR